MKSALERAIVGKNQALRVLAKGNMSAQYATS
jgi:hypothetical protein